MSQYEVIEITAESQSANMADNASPRSTKALSDLEDRQEEVKLHMSCGTGMPFAAPRTGVTNRCLFKLGDRHMRSDFIVINVNMPAFKRLIR